MSGIDAIAAAAGPGLIGGILVGLTAGKALALAAGKPFIAVNHLEAHALTARLTDAIEFPYLALLVSGGHTQLVAVRGVGDYQRLGSTVDDAAGEAFDKVGKMLGLPYPGGPQSRETRARGRRVSLQPAAADAWERQAPIFRSPASRRRCGRRCCASATNRTRPTSGISPRRSRRRLSM